MAGRHPPPRTRSTAQPKFDVHGGGLDSGTDTGDVPPPSCKVIDDMDAVGECRISAPPDSFEPELQWVWSGANGETWSVATPLVANLTDDDDNGEIDLCDVPDIVVVVSGPGLLGHLYVLDGASGAEHLRSEVTVRVWTFGSWPIRPDQGGRQRCGSSSPIRLAG